MLDEPVKLNINTCSDTELIAWVRHAFPIFEEVYRRFCVPKPMSCQECSRKAECEKHNETRKDKICLVLEPLLPAKNKGSGYREKNSGSIVEEYDPNAHQHQNPSDDDINVLINPDKSTLRSIRKTRLDEEFMLYKNCPPFIFKPEQWEAVYLRFEHDLKQQQIAEILGIQRSAVGDRLRRAKKNMLKYYKSKKSNTS